jgi:predicted esterase
MTFGTTIFEHKFIPPQESPITHLLVLVHGRTGNLRLLEWYSKRFKIPGLGFLTIQAPYLDQRPEQKEPAYSWYLEKYEGLEDSRTKLIHFMDELRDQGMPYEKIFWLGFSQGSAMGLDLALRGPQKYGGFFCISGFCLQADEYPQKFGPYAKKQQIFVSHGTRDEIIPVERAQVSYDKIKELGVPFEWRIYDKPHSFHLQKEVPEIEQQLMDWMK